MAGTALLSSLLARKKAGRDLEAEAGMINAKKGGSILYIKVVLHPHLIHRALTHRHKVQVTQTHHLHR